MKKSTWLVLLAMLAVQIVSSHARADDTSVAPFVNSQTSMILKVDMTAVDMDQITTFLKSASARSNMSDADRQKADADMEKSMATAKTWVTNFKTAGGKELYVVVQLNTIFQGKWGAVLVPLTPGADSAALTKLFNPDGDQPGANPDSPMAPTTATVNNTFVYAAGPMIKDFQSVPPEARADLFAGLAAGGNSPFCMVLSPSAIKNSPMVGMMMANMQRQNPGAPNPLQNPVWDNVTWTSLSFSLPPTESINGVNQCKDAASAQALLDMINQQITKMKTDPQTQQQLGDDAAKIADAIKPVLSGTTVTETIDKDTLDNVILPAFVHAADRNRVQHPPMNGGMDNGGPGGPGGGPGGPGGPGGGPGGPGGPPSGPGGPGGDNGGNGGNGGGM